jgi:hypothetical protein
LLFVQVLDKIRILPLFGAVLPVVLASATMAAGVYGTQLGLRAVGLGPSCLSLIVEGA